MTGPVLLYDVGNSTTKVALWRRDQLDLIVHCRANPRIRDLLDFSLLAGARGAVLSSVAPEISAEVRETYVRKEIPLVELNAASCIAWGILPGLYQGIGADRISHAIGLADHGTLPAVCIDIGTAVTIDRVDVGPHFDGGFIVPGPLLMAEALSLRTALIDVPSIEDVPFSPGIDTKSSVQSGCWWAVVTLIEGILDRLKSNGYPWNRLVVTGGWSSRISPLLAVLHESDPHHVFSGMRTVWRAYEAGHYPG